MEIGEEAIKYYFDQVYSGQQTKEIFLVIEFGYPRYEARDDNLDAQL